MANRNLLNPEVLTLEGFKPFGSYANMIDPAGVNTFDQPPIQFMPDMIELDTGSENASLSVCRVQPREAVVDKTEFHSFSGELILPLNGDILIHVGPPTPKDDPPLDQMRIFYVPQGTAVVLKRGVWHHAPFAVGNKSVSTLIGLPPRTYADDCEEVGLSGDDMLRIANA
jgi:ureidoglycolate lyase